MDRQLVPHDKEAEIGVLGAIIHHNGALGHAKEILQPEMFFSPPNRLIFTAILVLDKGGEPIDEITIKDALGPSGIERVGGMAYIAELVDMTPVASNVAVYSKIVSDKWQARMLMDEADKLKDAISKVGAVNGQVDDFKRAIQPIVAAGMAHRGISAKQAVAEFSAWLEVDEPPAPAKTFTKLDDYLFGIAPRKPTVIAARPGVGKTTFVAQASIANAEANVPSLLFSLEMDCLEIIARAISARSKIDGQKVLHRRTKEFYEQDWDNLSLASGELSELPFYIVAPANPLTVEQIENISRWHIENHGVQLVVIDHMRKITTEKGPIYEQQTKRICDLAHMARALNVAMLVANQINREGDDKPQLKHLEGSGAIEQESQAVVILHDKAPNSNEDRKIDGIIAKNRNGKKGVVPLQLIPWRYTIQ